MAADLGLDLDHALRAEVLDVLTLLLELPEDQQPTPRAPDFPRNYLLLAERPGRVL